MEFIGVCLITDDVMALTEFYCKVFNLDYDGDYMHTEIKIQDTKIAIFSRSGMEDMAPKSTEGIGYGGVTIMINVTNVDEEYERLKSLGIDIVKDIETYPWGSRSFWFKDPDGNIIDFLSSVSN